MKTISYPTVIRVRRARVEAKSSSETVPRKTPPQSLSVGTSRRAVALRSQVLSLFTAQAARLAR